MLPAYKKKSRFEVAEVSTFW